MLRTLWWRRQCVEPGLGTVIVETAILLGPEWDTDREAVISQQSRRLERLDKGWNTGKPGSESSAGCKTFCCQSEPCVSASRGGEYPTGSSCRTMKVCGNFVGRFFEDILCGYRESAYERKRRLVNFWNYSRAEYVRMRAAWNMYYLAVVDVVLTNVAYPE